MKIVSQMSHYVTDPAAFVQIEALFEIPRPIA
jgi:hypothetical protein